MLKLPALLLALAASGCFLDHEDPLVCADPEHDCTPPRELVDIMTVTPNLDLLLVIDDSSTMADKQDALRSAFPALLDNLAQARGGMPNLRIGVVTSDMGTKGTNFDDPGPPIGNVGAGGCSGTGKGGQLQLGGLALTNDDDTFLSIDRSGTTNFPGSLVGALTQITQVGSAGCGFEQPLHAMHVALDEANPGFVRPGANLGVIVLSDEDDCSFKTPALLGPESPSLGPISSFRCFRFGVTCTEDTSTLGTKTNCQPDAASNMVDDTGRYATFLSTLKADPRRVMFGGIVGDANSIVVENRPINNTDQFALHHTCSLEGPEGQPDFLVADPALRLAAVATQLGGSSRVESICSNDLTAQSQSMGSALAGLVEDSCLPEGFTAAAASECVVEDRRDATPDVVSTLKSCADTDGVGANCFNFVDDTACRSGLRLEVVRPIPPQGDEWSKLRCLN